MSAPKSKLAASTKPSLVSTIGWGIFWFLLGVPIIASVAGIVGGSDAGAVLLIWGYGGVVVWLWTEYRDHRKWSRRNDLDYRASQVIDRRLSDVAGRNEPLSDLSSGMRIIQGANVGEISQHFDQRLSASVSGWLHHELGLHGWGVGGSVGRVGLGVGKVGISGSSSVDLDVSGVIRNDLGGDGFVAVLEQDRPNGMIDTLRIIVPSEPACREYIANLLSAIGATFGTGSHVDETFRRYSSQLAASFPCDVSRVSDQIRALLRQLPERRPTVSVVGEDVGGSAILGGAIRIGADGPWHQLFPISRNRAILSAAEGL
ncbi:MAG: hypothetical protein H0U97_05445 [Gammaproteobacteria bacterium]|nr:hypothetical protein [Gammaproteobacteria bacterium]